MSNVEFHLIAFDEASNVIESLGANMTATFQNIEGQTQNLANTTTEATSQIVLDYDDVKFSMNALEEAQGSANASFGTSIMSMNNLALAGATLYMSFERVQNAQVMVDRSNLMVQRSTQTARQAQVDYNEAVAKFGPTSAEAQTALTKLGIANDALTVAQERADMSARNMNNAILMSTLMVVPSIIGIIGTMNTLYEHGTLAKIANTAASYGHAIAEQVEAAATYLASGAMVIFNAVCNANPILLVVTAIGALVGAFIAAYTYCEPFRNAINALGSALSGAFFTAVNVVRGALEWLWNNVLAPLGTFLNNVFGPVITFIIGLFQKLYDIVKPIIDAINTVKDVMGGFVNTISGALGSAGNAIGGFISSICFAHALQNAADMSAKTMNGWTDMVETSMDKGLSSIQDFNAEIGTVGMSVNASVALGGAPVTGVGLLARTPTMTNNFTFEVHGSIDKATAQLAADLVQESLKNVIVEPTSMSNSMRKRIRIGY